MGHRNHRRAHGPPEGRALTARTENDGKSQICETLSDHDIRFLKRVYEDSRNSRTLLERNPEYQGLVNRYTDLYSETIARALENERNSGT